MEAIGSLDDKEPNNNSSASGGGGKIPLSQQKYEKLCNELRCLIFVLKILKCG